jgi:pimeloyl-ACP methyl ester carboxylesterase
MSSGPALAHDDRGSGRAIVLIHGHPFNRGMWAPQLDSLARDFRVVAPDLPGYGASPPRGARITMRELADALLELVDELGIGRATVVGLSMGGLVAMELALARPDRVDGLVLAATTAAPVTPEEAHQRRELAADIEENGMLGAALGMAARLFGPSASKDPKLVEAVFAMMIHTPPAGAAAALRGRAERPDYSRLLSDLRVPSLVVAGDADPYAPAPVTDQLVASLPAPEVVRLAGVGHLPNLEAPERFDATLRAFVSSGGVKAA